MPKEFSFDIRYTPNLAEVENAHNQALKELSQRYDFQGTKTTLELDKKDLIFTMQTNDEMKLRNLRDILERRLTGRHIPIPAQIVTAPVAAGGGTVRQTIKIQQGLPEDKIPKINAVIKGLHLKVRHQIQGNEIRVFARSKDELQTVMNALRQNDFGCALDFGNYR